MGHLAVRNLSITFLSLVLAGFASPAESDPGTLDESFGESGVVRAGFPDGFNAFATSVAVQDDGRILVGGIAKVVGPKQLFGLMRFRTDGRLDDSFSGDGRVTWTPGILPYDVAVQANGKILEAGISRQSDFAIVRFRSDGSVNESFGEHGGAITDICGSCNAEINAIAIDFRGRIVAAGDAGNMIAIARYHADGTLDKGFGDHGVVRTNLGGGMKAAADVALEPNGKIVITGVASVNDGDFAVARFGVDGTPDDSFGDHGLVTTNFGADSDDEASALAIRRKGKIVAVGSSGCASCSGPFDFAVARYLPGGALDIGFSGDGTTTISIGPGSEYATAVVPQRHGRTLFTGGTGCRVELARTLADGTLDPAFGTGGTVRSLWGGCANGWDAARYGRTKVVVAGPDENRFGLARYRAA